MKALRISILVLLCPSLAFAQFDLGFDFRATSGFVTDPTYGVFATSTDTYPKSYTAANGSSANAGFTQGSPSARDRSASVDPRLAGIVFGPNNSATVIIFRVDLPATGSYTISVASGDQASGQVNNTVTLADGGTVFATVSNNASPGADQYYDASGVLRTSSTNWVSSQATISHTFTSTQATVLVGCNCGQATNSVITTVRFTAAGGGGTSAPPTQMLTGVGL